MRWKKTDILQLYIENRDLNSFNIKTALWKYNKGSTKIITSFRNLLEFRF
jgi:hypothetical protein